MCLMVCRRCVCVCVCVRVRVQNIPFLEIKANIRINSSSSFRFGDATVKSLGMIVLELYTHDTVAYIPVLMDIVSVHVPHLMGLDILDENNFRKTT